MHDVIIIGSGHNGLVAAARLAARGHSVLVLEKRGLFGGRMAAYSPFPGFAASPCLDHGGRLRPALEKELGLARHGLRWRAADPLVFAPTRTAGESLTLWRDEAATRAEIARFSRHDAEQWPRYRKFMRRAAAFGEQIQETAAPRLDTTDASQVFDAGRLGMRFRLLGKDDMVRMMRLATMTMVDWLDEWFESPLLKAALAAPALLGAFVGPYAPATAGLLAWREACGVGEVAEGGGGALIRALVEACRAAGVELRAQSEVREIVSEPTPQGTRTTGVRLGDGSILPARTVIADVDPRGLIDLLGPGAVPAEYLHSMRSVRSRGLLARMFLRLRELPRFGCLGENPDGQRLAGRIHFGPTLRAIEEAFDDAKYGRWSPSPIVEMTVPSLHDPETAPSGEHLATLTIAAAPYALRGKSWAEERDRLADHVIDHLSTYMPNLRDAVVERAVLTPVDLEQQYGLSGGHVFHGELGLDQLFLTRPVGESARYQTPLAGLYVCGAGTHPGGAAIGLSGELCAEEVDLREDGGAGLRARNRKMVTTAVGAGLALLGAGLAARAAAQKLKGGDEPQIPEGGNA
jgi:phytoene dehydrogenase-like protein